VSGTKVFLFFAERCPGDLHRALVPRIPTKTVASDTNQLCCREFDEQVVNEPRPIPARFGPLSRQETSKFIALEEVGEGVVLEVGASSLSASSIASSLRKNSDEKGEIPIDEVSEEDRCSY